MYVYVWVLIRLEAFLHERVKQINAKQETKH